MVFVAFFGTLGALTIPLCDDACVTIDSSHAEYDGKAVSLHGDVAIKHLIGEITCQSAKVFPDEGYSEAGPQQPLLKLAGDVIIKMAGGGTLSCSLADFDSKEGVATFYSGDDDAFVVYKEFPDVREKESSFLLKSRRMKVFMQEKEKNSVKEVHALGDVHFNYCSQIVAIGDKAVYYFNSENSVEEPSSQISGLLALTSAEEERFCQVFLQNGERIQSKSIHVDTVQKEITFNKPEGLIRGRTVGEEPGTFSFRSDEMIWKIPDNTAKLMGDIEIRQEDFAEIKVLGELTLVQEKGGAKNRVSYVSIKGKMVLQRFDQDLGLCYTLKNDGTAIIDNQTSSLLLEKADLPGSRRQVHFQDQLGEAFSNKLIVYYSINNKSFDAHRILLEGNVKLKNSAGNSLLQLMLADSIEYFPLERILNMKALKNKRVLFFDKINNMQISAPALKASRDQNSSKDTLQGIGDVRFRFLEQEMEQLKKRFY